MVALGRCRETLQRQRQFVVDQLAGFAQIGDTPQMQPTGMGDLIVRFKTGISVEINAASTMVPGGQGCGVLHHSLPLIHGHALTELVQEGIGKHNPIEISFSSPQGITPLAHKPPTTGQDGCCLQVIHASQLERCSHRQQ